MAKSFDREAVIDLLINEAAFDENDRPTLNKFSDEVLSSFVSNGDEDEDEEDDSEDDTEEYEDDEEDSEEEDSEERNEERVYNGYGKKVKNRKPMMEDDEEDMEENMGSCGSGKKKMTKNQSANEWLNSAPPEIREVVVNAMNAEKNRKQALVSKITSNSANTFNPKFLMTKDTEELEAIARLADRPSQSYVGNNAPSRIAITNNSKKSSGPLTIPTMNFSSEDDE